jgi:metallophosphoesterase superfamily enzyme
MLEIELEGEKIALLPERALYWPAQHTLIVADLHWGKAGHFRKNGIAIPAQAQQHDEIRLASVISKYKVQRLVVAGDIAKTIKKYKVSSTGGRLIRNCISTW